MNELDTSCAWILYDKHSRSSPTMNFSKQYVYMWGELKMSCKLPGHLTKNSASVG